MYRLWVLANGRQYRFRGSKAHVENWARYFNGRDQVQMKFTVPLV